jgi:hypothetical protein
MSGNKVVGVAEVTIPGFDDSKTYLVVTSDSYLSVNMENFRLILRKYIESEDANYRLVKETFGDCISEMLDVIWKNIHSNIPIAFKEGDTFFNEIRYVKITAEFSGVNKFLDVIQKYVTYNDYSDIQVETKTSDDSWEEERLIQSKIGNSLIREFKKNKPAAIKVDFSGYVSSPIRFDHLLILEENCLRLLY